MKNKNNYFMRNDTDLDRIDLTHSQRRKKHRRKKLDKRDYYNRVIEETI